MNEELRLAIGADTSSFDASITKLKKEFNSLQADMLRKSANPTKGLGGAFGRQVTQAIKEMRRLEKAADNTFKSIQRDVSRGLFGHADYRKLNDDQKKMLEKYTKMYVKELNIQEAERRRIILGSLEKQKQKEHQVMMARRKLIKEISSYQIGLSKKEMAEFVRDLTTKENRELQSIRRIAKARAATTPVATSTINPNNRVGDITAHRPFLDSVKVVAKYGAISQALYGIQNAMVSVAGESLRFNQSIATIGAVFDKSRAESEYLAQASVDLAIKFGSSIDEISDALLTLGRAGVDNTDKLKKALEGLAGLALLTGDSVADGAAAMAGMMSVFPEAAENVDKLSNSMTVIANKTRLGLHDFSTIANYALTTAKSLGITAEAYLALGGAMSKVGLNASTIGTSIRRLGKLAYSQSKDIQNFFLELGMTQADFARAMQEDSISAIQHLSKAMRDFKGEGGLQSILPNQIQLKNTLNTLVQINEQQYLQKMYDAIEKGGDKANQLMKQTQVASLGIQRVLTTIGNSIKSMYNQGIDKIFRNMFYNVNVYDFQKQVKSAVASLKTMLGVLVDLATAFLIFKTTTISIMAMVKAVEIAKAAMVGLQGAIFVTAAATNRLKIALAGLGKGNLIGIVASGLYLVYQYLKNSNTEADKLAKSFNKSAKELAAMTKAQQSVYLIQAAEKRDILLDKQRQAQAEIYKFQIKHGKELSKYTEEQKKQLVLLKANRDTAKQNTEEAQKTVDEVGKLVNGEQDAVTTAKNLGAEVQNVSSELSNAAAKAVQLDISLGNAMRSLRGALRSLNAVMTGGSTISADMVGLGEEFNENANSIDKINKAMDTTAQKLNELVGARIKEKGYIDDEFLKQEGIIDLQNKLTEMTVKSTKLKEKQATLQHKAIVEGNQAAVDAIEMSKQQQEIAIKTQYAQNDITSAKKKAVNTAKESLSIAELTLKAAKEEYQYSDSKESKDAAKLKVQQAELAVLKAKQALTAAEAKKDTTGAADARAKAKAAADELNILSAMAELRQSEIQLGYDEQGLIMSKYNTNMMLLEVYEAQAEESQKAADAAYELVRANNDNEIVLKKYIALQTKANKDASKVAKQRNKEITKFQKDMKKVGSNFADGLLSGDIKGAFKGLFDDIVSVFVEPLKDAFSELFGDTMKSLVGSFYDTFVQMSSKAAAQDIANSQAQGQASASAAVAKSASYGGWVTMAAMAAAMAGLGYLVSGIGGSGGGMSESDYLKTRGYEDPSSQTITNLLDSIDWNTTRELTYSRGIYDNIRALVIQSGKAAVSLTGRFDLSKPDTSITNSGIGGWRQTSIDTIGMGLTIGHGISSVITEDFKKVKEHFWSGDSVDYWTTAKSAGQEFDKLIKDAYDSNLNLIRKTADAFGVSVEEVDAAIAKLGAHSFEILNKSDEEVAALINGAMGEDYDQVMEDVLSWMKKYVELGEGFGETAARLVSETEQIQEGFRSLGETFGQLNEYTVGMTQAFIEASSGLDNALNNIQGYIDNFYTDAEKQELRLSKIMRYGLMFDTKDEYKQKITELSELASAGSTEAAKQMATLLSLQDTYKQYFDYLNEATTNSLADIMDAWLGDLSYLTIQQKADLATKYFEENRNVASAEEMVRAAIQETRTKEEYIPIFNKYIAELEKEDNATLGDVVGRLDILVAEVRGLEETQRKLA